MEEYREVRNRTMQAVADTVEGPKETVEKMAEKIADAVMDAIAENYRSITEVHSIVEAVRAAQAIRRYPQVYVLTLRLRCRSRLSVGAYL